MSKTQRFHRLVTSVACVALLLAAPALAAEQPTAIRGQIYISPTGSPEGDLVMRAAQTEVLLVRGSGAFEAELAKLRESRAPIISKQLQAVNLAQELLVRAAAAARDEIEKRSSQLRQERAKLTELREAYQKDVAALFAKHTVAKTKTDGDGRFSFTGIPPARYLIHAHFEILGMDIHYYWLLPVELQGEKPAEVALTKLNATTTF